VLDGYGDSVGKNFWLPRTLRKLVGSQRKASKSYRVEVEGEIWKSEFWEKIPLVLLQSILQDDRTMHMTQRGVGRNTKGNDVYRATLERLEGGIVRSAKTASGEWWIFAVKSVIDEAWFSQMACSMVLSVLRVSLKEFEDGDLDEKEKIEGCLSWLDLMQREMCREDEGELQMMKRIYREVLDNMESEQE
jgi:hypothetical protein